VVALGFEGCGAVFEVLECAEFAVDSGRAVISPGDKVDKGGQIVPEEDMGMSWDVR
jgi:hypothetical protein